MLLGMAISISNVVLGVLIYGHTTFKEDRVTRATYRFTHRDHQSKLNVYNKVHNFTYLTYFLIGALVILVNNLGVL